MFLMLKLTTGSKNYLEVELQCCRNEETDSACEQDSACIIRLNNSSILYLREVTRFLVLVCILRDEAFTKRGECCAREYLWLVWFRSFFVEKEYFYSGWNWSISRVKSTETIRCFTCGSLGFAHFPGRSAYNLFCFADIIDFNILCLKQAVERVFDVRIKISKQNGFLNSMEGASALV